MKTCEVVMTSPTTCDQRECGKPAARLINGFPMCSDHRDTWRADQCIETDEALPGEPPPAAARSTDDSGPER